MKILIQKFGGTSVSTKEKRQNVVERIKEAIDKGYSTVVVVSAMGRKGAPYATDTLRTLLDDKFKKNNLLAADLIMSCGEIISTAVVCNELYNQGIDAVPLTGGQAGIITDENYGSAEVENVVTDNLMNLLKQGKVPVVAGFQGKTKFGNITTLGRGASDFTASLLGVSLKAEKIAIYTDVDGIMTADPRIVENASLIKKISYNEVFQFADQGAKVIHPRAVEMAMKGNIPLIIKNTAKRSEGTLINSMGNDKENNVITGITSMNNRIQVRVKLENNKGNEHYNYILDILAQNSISIDLINVFPNENIFTIDNEDFEDFIVIMKKYGIKYSYVKECSKIALIGNRMRGIPGVMARILKALTKHNIEVLQTADSHTTIWCLVGDNNVTDAIKALHDEFKMYKI